MTRSLGIPFVAGLCCVVLTGCSGVSLPEETADTGSNEQYAASHILLRHDQPTGKGQRTEAEARELAKQLIERLKRGEDFAELAREYSDDTSAKNGGDLEMFSLQGVVPAFGEALSKMKVGETSGIVASNFGIHIIRRNEIYEPAQVRHILVTYKGLVTARAEITRTKEEALARITECMKKARAGESFKKLARQYSDDLSTRDGGDMGGVRRNQSAFSKAAYACPVGEVSEIFETPAGYHILQRYR